MHFIQKPGNTFRFTKRDLAVLTRLLERMYVNEMMNYKFFNDYPDSQKKKTQLTVIDRKYRLEIKAMQLLLHRLKSPLLLEQNGKQRPNFRKTLDIETR